MIEIWKDVIGYEGLYQVSNLGRVKSLAKIAKNKYGEFMLKDRIMKTHIKLDGYRSVTFVKNGKVKLHSVHRLVAKAFVPNPNNYHEVNHIDEDKTNSRFDNLEWCNRLYNVNYGTGIERRIESRRKNNLKILQLDETGTIIKEWNDLNEIIDNGYSKTGVWKCCKGYQEIHRGYRWKYKI